MHSKEGRSTRPARRGRRIQSNATAKAGTRKPWEYCGSVDHLVAIATRAGQYAQARAPPSASSTRTGCQGTGGRMGFGDRFIVCSNRKGGERPVPSGEGQLRSSTTGSTEPDSCQARAAFRWESWGEPPRARGGYFHVSLPGGPGLNQHFPKESVRPAKMGKFSRPN